MSDFAIVVPVDNQKEYEANVLGSPVGYLRDIVPVLGAANAREAWDRGVAQTQAEWIVFCHQDVYFPIGTGPKLREIMARSDSRTITGFCGMGFDAEGRVNPAGSVKWWATMLSWPASDHAVSIDEFCILMHRSCPYWIDAALGWHLWGTDLALQAEQDEHPARIARVLMHHNSTLGELPAEFHRSMGILKSKWAGRKIQTLNGGG